MKGLMRLLSVFVVLMFFAVDAWAYKPKILQLKDLHPGTKAIGFSVFKGVEPEPFDVVLGNTIDNMGSSLILARISGGPMDTTLEKIGAISGMSGSPIFVGCNDLDDCVKNGILVGALSYRIGSFIEGGMNCLLTPAEYMLGARFGGYEAAISLSNQMPDKINIGGMEFFNLMLFPKINNLAAQGVSPGKCYQLADSELKPGSMVSVLLARGLISIGASGTVTWRDDDKIYIFGHPLFGTGMVNYPFVHVAVADTIQTPFASYKLPGCYLNTEGAMLVDGAFEMAGIIGMTAPGTPLITELHLGNGQATLKEEVIPSPMARMLINKLPGIWAEQVLGDLSLLPVSYQVRISIQDESEIFLKNIIPVRIQKDQKDPKSPFQELFDRVDLVLESLKGKKLNRKIGDVMVRVDFVKNFKVWIKKAAFLSENKASPGETVYADMILEEISSGALRKISVPIKVPEDFMERIGPGVFPNIVVVIQGGSRFTDKRSLTNGTSVEDFIKQLNEAMNYKTDVLYVQQVMPKAKTETKAKNSNSQTSANPELGWVDIGEDELKHFLTKDSKEVVLTLTPILDDFIDVDFVLNITVQTKGMSINEKKEPKKRKWFLLYLF